MLPDIEHHGGGDDESPYGWNLQPGPLCGSRGTHHPRTIPLPPSLPVKICASTQLLTGELTIFLPFIDNRYN